MSGVNKIIDYATGKELRNNPEELYRQLFEHILIDDLGYPKEHIDIEVIIQRGSKRDAEKADIVVYKSSKHTQDNMYMVIEIETPKKKYDQQALSYSTATTAPYCIWFAGFEKTSDGPYYLYRNLANDPTNFLPIPALPRYGETQDSIGKYRKSDLKPAKDLKIVFRRIHHKLYGSGPIKREENVAREVIKVLFCKIMDEISHGEICEFRGTPAELNSSEGKKKIKERINKLYHQLVLDPDFGEMFAEEQLEYDEEWIAYLVAELQGLYLLHEDTNTDAFGDAYEVLLPSTLRGESGQFFTPREVVRFAINLIDPSFANKDTILDPACGSGGFLSIAIEHLRKQINKLYENRGVTHDKLNSILKEHAGKYIHGIDIEPLLYRIAKSYMAIMGDGKSNIYNFDSLEPIDRFPDVFLRKVKLGSVDVITTNPPFGTKIDDVRPYVLEQYDLGHRLSDGERTSELLPGQDPDKLFLERCMQLLKEPDKKKPGGRMAIVLPRQNLSGAENGSVQLRKWLLKQARILAIIDLPREAFQPHTGTKTSIVFLQKTYNPEEDYPIFMAVSEAVGHDRRGNPIFKKDDQGKILKDSMGQSVIWNDLPEILEEWKKYQAGNMEFKHSPSCFTISSNQVRQDSLTRIDAWYWDPNKNDLAKKIENVVNEEVHEIVRLGDLVVDGGIFYPGRHKRNYVKKSSDSLPFYSGTQILQIRPFDLKYQPKDYRPARNHIVEKDCILVTRSGSTGRVVMVNDDLAGAMVSEHVIRVICDPALIDPYYVYAYLASDKIGKILMAKGIYASVVDHLTPNFIGSIPIARLTESKEKEIADFVRNAEEQRAKANKTFLSNMSEIQDIVLRAAGINPAEVEGIDDISSED